MDRLVKIIYFTSRKWKRKIFQKFSFLFLFYFNQKIFLVSLHSILAFLWIFFSFCLFVRLFFCVSQKIFLSRTTKKKICSICSDHQWWWWWNWIAHERVAEISFSVGRGKKSKEKFDSHFLACSGLKRNYSIFFWESKRFHQQQIK